MGSMVVPLILLVRQLLSWNYIHKRLSQETIDYEESGWYDGQKWEKNFEVRRQDLLIANYEVKPLIILITKALKITACIFLISLSLYTLL